MLTLLPILVIMLMSSYKLVSYGQWAKAQDNLRGAIGLYVLALLTLVVPVSIYVINMLH